MYTVLVAENEPWVLKGIVEMVEAAGEEFEIVGACLNGEEAWSMIHEVWPMLLITDIQMPELDGLSLIQRIDEHRTPLVSIIISGYDNFQYAQKAMSYGVSEYLLKPVEFEVLKKTLHRSKDKLESLKDLNKYVIKFQALLDNSQKLAPKLAMQKQLELIQSVLQLNYLNKNAQVGLINIFESKLKMLFHEFDIPFKPSAGYAAKDNVAIISYYKDLLEKWYLSQPSSVKASMPDSIERSCAYIRQHYKDDITLTDMADFTNFSVSHFSALFKKHTGTSLVNYVNRLKIEEAKRLLIESSYAVSEIAEIVGFSTMPYFTRVFKTIVGLSPLEYRKRLNP